MSTAGNVHLKLPIKPPAAKTLFPVQRHRGVHRVKHNGIRQCADVSATVVFQPCRVV